MTHRGLWNLVIGEVLRERGALPKEEGDDIRGCKAMHEENFLSTWSRKMGERKKKERWK